MPHFKDQLGRKIFLEQPPKRVISLVPSQTELLLFWEVKVVGRTKFCIHPQELVKNTPIIGGTKKFNFSKIDELNPDLIIGNKEENYEQGIETLAQRYPVWISDIITIEDNFKMMYSLAEIFQIPHKAQSLITQLQQDFEQFTSLPKVSVAYFIWQNPLLVAANNTFINHILSLAGFENVFNYQERYPEISTEELKRANPSHIFLSSEPYPFKAKHIKFFQEICPQAVITLVDGELFSWYGSRLLKTSHYLKELRESLG